MDPVEVWRSAQLMIKMHGADAPARCAEKAAEFQAKNDEVGQMIWLTVGRAALSLLTEGVPTDFDEMHEPESAASLDAALSQDRKIGLQLSSEEIGCLLVLAMIKRDEVRVKSHRRFLTPSERAALTRLGQLLDAARVEMETALARAATANPSFG
jgi:hypothetical protein